MAKVISQLLRVAALSLLSLSLQAQTVSKPNGKSLIKEESNPRLVRTETVPVSSMMALGFDNPLVCDENENIYIRTDESGVDAVTKISPKGEKLAVFEAYRNPDLPKIDAATYFAVSGTTLYQLVFPHEVTRYVFEFKSDGTYKSKVKLDPGFPWMPDQLAVFPSGQFFVTGQSYASDGSGAMWPFSGIFSSDGHLLKEVRLQDDETLHDMAAKGDARVGVPGIPSMNHAISNGYAEVGNDGNVYVMRWTDPAIVYAISAGGEVVRRFAVDPGLPAYRPAAMHIRDGRIAILFAETQTYDYIMKVVDFEGNEVGTFTHPSDSGKSDAQRLSSAFACITSRPQKFIFAGAGDDNRVQLWIAEAR